MFGFRPDAPKTEQGEELNNALLAMTTAQRAITEKDIEKAAEILQKYKDDKANLEHRLVEDEEWYKIRHWDYLRKNMNACERARKGPEPSSGWLFSAVQNKHADAMDNYPEPNVLPREASDEGESQKLSSILPVILERNSFEKSYSENWWEKLKHGTGAYGIFWNSSLENGLGDIDIKPIDLLNIFWEPGISDIQKSRNIFVAALIDNEQLQAEYPKLDNKALGSKTIDIAEYIYDDTVDTSEKSVVIDWYYKVKSASGKTLVHYAKFVGNTLLFASENEEEYTERGYYDHGKYPFVFDTLFPEKGTPVGFGLVSTLKEPQIYIDTLDAAVLDCAVKATKPRFWSSNGAGVNKEQFLDWDEPIVDVEGSIDESRLKQITVNGPQAYILTALDRKVNEMKETSSNRDVSNGGTGSGVTAASAIAALQEAGNKTSRDMISSSYRAYTEICYMCIDLIRQFYDEKREFRITNKAGEMEFISYSNALLKEQSTPPFGAEGIPTVRVPIFDIRVKAQKKNPFSRASQNELAKELYAMGFFSPEKAQETMGALELMEFEGKNKVEEYARQGQTLLNVCKQMSQQLDQMAAVIQTLTGKDMGVGAPIDGGRSGGDGAAPGGGINASMAEAQQELPPMAQKMAENSVPDIGRRGGSGCDTGYI